MELFSSDILVCLQCVRRVCSEVSFSLLYFPFRLFSPLDPFPDQGRNQYGDDWRGGNEIRYEPEFRRSQDIALRNPSSNQGSR